MYKLVVRATYGDKAAGEREIVVSDLDWTLVYPVMLTNGPATGSVRVLDLESIERLPGMPRVTRDDVAEVLVETVLGDESVRATIVVTS